LATGVVGVAIAAVALAIFLTYGLIGSFGCNGSDAGEGVQPGTLGDALCGPPLLGVFLICCSVGVLAPIVGAAHGWRGVAAGFTAASGALTLLALVFHAASGDTWNGTVFILPPLTAFVVGVLLSTRRYT
jgi:hypothetical protein